MHDEDELAAMELQIREFGQTPRQLFVAPHPSRLSSRGAEPVEEEVRTVGSTTEGLSRTDSSPGNSWGAQQGSLNTPTNMEEEWVLVSPKEGEEAQVSGEHVRIIDLIRVNIIQHFCGLVWSFTSLCTYHYLSSSRAECC